MNPWLGVALLIAAGLYVRGWRVLTGICPERYSGWRLASFLGGLATIWLALGSRLDSLTGLLLSAHMVQHLLLLSVIPILVLLGWPFLPLLRGLPRGFAHDGLGPFLNWPPLRRLANALTHPLTGWFALV